MTVNSLIKKEKRLLKRLKGLYDNISRIKLYLEKINIWQVKDYKKNSFLELAGFVEIGPMISEDIDKEIYNK